MPDRSREIHCELLGAPPLAETEPNSSELDGISCEYPQWWFNVRASNTEPLLRLIVEADTRELMEAKRDELLAVIRG